MIRKALLVAALAASAAIAGCGSGASRAFTGTTSSANWVTHADPVTLLPFAHQLTGLIRPISAPNRHDQALNPSNLNSAFGAATSRAIRLASGVAQLGLTGRSGSQLYVQLFVFRTLAGARSLTPTLLAATRLGRGRLPSGGAGEQREVSRQPYGHNDVSYRDAFREQNVLAVVELDGPRNKYSGRDVLKLAALADQRISATLKSPR